AGVPPGVSVNLGANPNAGEALTVTFMLPDGSTENVTLTATILNPPAENQFTIGVNAAATAVNLQSALTAAVTKLADTSLVAASAMAAANDFFDTDAGNPPQRVNGPPFGTATSLVDGTAANTVSWYAGEAGSSSARTTGVARVDPAVTIFFGMRANEQALRTVVKNVAVFAAASFSASDPNASGQYDALTSRLSANHEPPPGAQSISGLAAEIANAQIMAKNAQDRHQQLTVTLTDFLQSIENVSPEQVGTELLALQTSLQASLQTTAMLSKLTLVNYLS
ncbi:MAG: flagellin, partial [bacterium]